MAPDIDPYGLANPHRGGCKICGQRKQVITADHDREPGYFLIRFCDTCDTPVGCTGSDDEQNASGPRG